MTAVQPTDPRRQTLARILSNPEQQKAIEREYCTRSLSRFMKRAWHVLDPSQPFVEGWAIDAICEHLEAVTAGQITRLLINVPPGFSKPVQVDQPIIARRGVVPLKDIKVGDEVLTHKGRFRRVTVVHEQGFLPVWNLTTFCGREIVAAPDHPFLTAEGWKRLDCMDERDVVGVPRCEESFGDSSMSSEEARLLGYLVGDGCISQRSLSFVNTEEEIIEDFMRCASAVGFYAERKLSHPNKRVSATKVILKSTERRWDKKFGEPPVLAWLKKHGLYRSNSYTKHIPQQVFSSGLEALRNFIGAYWSCDGCIQIRHSSGRTCFLSNAVTVSENLADDLLRGFTLIGCHARKRAKDVKLNSKKQPGGYYRSFEVITSSQDYVLKFADLPGLCERKRKKAAEARRFYFEHSIFSDPVDSIAPYGNGVCRCLTVEEDSSFVVNGVAVHNSVTSSAYWPAWEWGPKGMAYTRYLTTSYTNHYVKRDARRMRDLVISEWYSALWGDQVELSRSGETSFENTKTGWREGVPFQSLHSGRGHRVIIDDPHSLDEAESKADRERVVQRFAESVPSRLVNPEEDAIVVIMHRVHQRDVSGFILQKDLGYEHLMLPMEFEPARRCTTSIGFTDPRKEEGELLFPERFPRKVVERDRESQGSYAFAAQLQQRPAPRGGGMIKLDWFKRYRTPPAEFDYLVHSWDTANKGGQSNAYSVGGIWGVVNNLYYLLWVYRERMDIPQLERKVKQVGQYDAYGVPAAIVIEDAASGTGVIQHLRQETALPIIPWPVKGDKETRMDIETPAIESGLVVLPEDAPWLLDFESEVQAFPNSENKDQVDQMSQFLKWMREGNRRMEEDDWYLI